MKVSKPTLQAFLDWVVTEQQGPTGWAVSNPALEVLRFAEQNNINLDTTNYDKLDSITQMSHSDRYNYYRTASANRRGSAALLGLSGTANDPGVVTGQLET